MAPARTARFWIGHPPAVVSAGCFLVAAVLGLLTAHHGGIRDFESLDFATASYRHFLSDEAIHREQPERLLEKHRELHYESNDRLVRFAYLSSAAEDASQASWSSGRSPFAGK